MKDLKEKTIRGGFARMCAQGANFSLRVASLTVLARILGPEDFGLVGMVTAFTGVLSLFRDFGLSSAAIQRTNVTEEQSSTLFWINFVVGGLLALLAVAIAPFIADFYHEPKLLAVTVVLASGFLFNGAGVQHGVLLQREMRFTTLAAINTISLVVSSAIAIAGAKAGYGYWALVAMAISVPLIMTICVWLATAWVPGMPCRQSGIRSMLRFGGTVTLNSLVVYIANNFEKVLLGRFWGVDAVGIYGRAYQLINIPTENMNSTVGEVAFSALSRVQHDPERLKSYFLKGYSLVLAMTLPVTIACAIFADDIVIVLLGPKWKEAAAIFRLLAPTMLVFAVANPLGWLLTSLGLVGRNLKAALVIAPIMIAGYVTGLRYGPKGVAFGYSAALVICVLPLIAWCVRGTVISFRDVLLTVSRPFGSSILAAAIALGTRNWLGQSLPPLLRLVLEISMLVIAYAGTLLYVAGQKAFYVDLLRGLRRPATIERESLVSV